MDQLYLAVITALLSVDTIMLAYFIKKTMANGDALTVIKTRCSIFHGEKGEANG